MLPPFVFGATASSCLRITFIVLRPLYCSSLSRYPVLHSLVFVEGVVNDATAIVLLTATQQLSTTMGDTGLDVELALGILITFARLFVLSLLLGVAIGLASAAIVR